ncbi:MAG: hypothetical protein R3C58_03660 [Parvularculaceae bacterium]
MNMIMRLLGSLPRNASLPVIASLAGWYGGAKYGAPDYVMNTVDGFLAQGGAIVGNLLPAGDDAAPAEDAGA